MVLAIDIFVLICVGLIGILCFTKVIYPMWTGGKHIQQQNEELINLEVKLDQLGNQVEAAKMEHEITVIEKSIPSIKKRGY